MLRMKLKSRCQTPDLYVIPGCVIQLLTGWAGTTSGIFDSMQEPRMKGTLCMVPVQLDLSYLAIDSVKTQSFSIWKNLHSNILGHYQILQQWRRSLACCSERYLQIQIQPSQWFSLLCETLTCRFDREMSTAKEIDPGHKNEWTASCLWEKRKKLFKIYHSRIHLFLLPFLLAFLIPFFHPTTRD